ncbi:hypothetical protein QWY22_04755 [Planococcus liqunii]|uniref:hypothetical protein n=1 Tax=Planococcus liqunii TaxID=3058394 RepID=UPI0026092DFE|nr:hypothetical protein [Planococcus sp. N056]WKA51919.1 hypothetical protein QWY22_04755 [Planococcus sp. N056]
MMQSLAKRPPMLAWLVLIVSAFILVSMLPIIFMTAVLPIWRPEEFSIVSVVMLVVALSFAAGALLSIRWAKRTIGAAVRRNSELEEKSMEHPPAFPQAEKAEEKKKPVWPWLVIAPGALLLVSTGPGAVMLPIMPLFLAGMSTDSGNTSDYVPALIILIGYGIMGIYGYWLFRAIKVLRKT